MRGFECFSNPSAKTRLASIKLGMDEAMVEEAIFRLMYRTGRCAMPGEAFVHYSQIDRLEIKPPRIRFGVMHPVRDR